MLLWLIGFGYATWTLGWSNYGVGNIMLFY
jgi:hypothetical protein